MIGANAEAIATAEDRERVQAGDDRDRPQGAPSRRRPHMDEALARWSAEIGLPVIIRPAYILGGRGTGIATHARGVRARRRQRPRRQPDQRDPDRESIAGWKEYELEVMRDRADNCVIICSIENVDPMGVHTGDSITVAPAQTLSDVEYQQMRDAAFACIRRVGVETGGSQRAVRRQPGRRRPGRHRDEPRVSRSVGAGVEGHRVPDRQDRRQAGRRLHARRDPQRHHQEDPGQLRAEHRLRRHQDPALGVREVARHVGCSAPRCSRSARRWHRPHVPREPAEGLRSLEQGRSASTATRPRRSSTRRSDDDLLAASRSPPPTASSRSSELLRRGVGIERVHVACRIDPWFLDQMSHDHRGAPRSPRSARGDEPARGEAGQAARLQRRQLAYLWGIDEPRCAPLAAAGVLPTYKTVDTCAAEFAARRRTTTRPTRTRTRCASSDRPEGDHPRFGPQPHRSGHRVRLLLRARRRSPCATPGSRR
jgi:carbamoyl-phosphate synthase large subunit